VYHRAVRLLLASASPRRRDLLAAAGLAFVVDAVNVDEQPLDAEAPAACVERLARLKASVAAEQHPEVAVIGADTAVILDNEILGKPADARDAVRMLTSLAGRQHEVLTGIAVAWQGQLISEVARTGVWMHPMSARDIAEYVGTGEPFDKAGSYAIQGLGARLISHIEGSYTNVVGLPVAALLQLLARARILSG
jgi:septum formation protein